MRVRLTMAALACGSILAAWQAHAQDGGDVRRGEALLVRHCSPCHAVGRSGASAHAEAPPLRTLGQRYPVEALQEALAEGMVTGHPDMPEFRFSPGDVGAVIAYLKSIQEP